MFPSSYLILHLLQRGEGDKMFLPGAPECAVMCCRVKASRLRSFSKGPSLNPCLNLWIHLEPGIRMGASSPIENRVFWKAEMVLLDR